MRSKSTLLLPLLLPLAAGCPAMEEPPASLPPLFSDVTEDWGVQFEAPAPETLPVLYPDKRAGGGGVLSDLDGDGDLDLLLTAPFGHAVLLANEGDRFVARDSGAGIEELDSLVDARAADLDSDGLPDLLVAAGQSVRLYRNLGASFVEAPALATFEPEVRPVATSVADVDGDWHPDVYVLTWGVSEDYGMDPVPGHDRFFLGRGGMAFEEAPGVFPDKSGLSFSSCWMDLEGDLDLDLFVVRYDSLQVGGNAMFIRREGLAFEDVAASLGLDAPSNGMGADVADLQGDGSLEFAVSDTDHRVVILSLTEAGAIDVDQALGAVPADVDAQRDSWGVQYWDVDDDGDLDLLVPWGNKDPDPVYTPQRPSMWIWQDGRFTDGTDPGLPAPLSHAWRTVLPGDLDGDGTLDLVWTSAIGPVSIQLGRPTGNHHIEVALPPGRGLGARVEVDGMTRRISAGGSGLHSSLPPVARFGLGPRTRAQVVRVSWPDGEVTVIEDVEADQRIAVE